jgi:hypothetical protein
MAIKEDYIAYKQRHGLRTDDFNDRVKLQLFLRDRIDELWREGPGFFSGGLLKNYMTGYALGFAYYDCRPTPFCKSKCYGLPLAGGFDFNMFRLSVITSESLKSGDKRYKNAVIRELTKLQLECLKIGHWGDAVPKQVSHVAEIVEPFPSMTCWWYTRKKQVAIAVNQLGLPNLRAYLSLDPDTEYPTVDEYPYGFTYLYGDDVLHENHDDIIGDERLVAIFSLKKGQKVEDPDNVELGNHLRICIEKKWKARSHKKGELLCLRCQGRCNFSED